MPNNLTSLNILESTNSESTQTETIGTDAIPADDSKLKLNQGKCIFIQMFNCL